MWFSSLFSGGQCSIHEYEGCSFFLTVIRLMEIKWQPLKNLLYFRFWCDFVHFRRKWELWKLLYCSVNGWEGYYSLLGTFIAFLRIKLWWLKACFSEILNTIMFAFLKGQVDWLNFNKFICSILCLRMLRATWKYH